ncbi:hypothetical protein ACM64Y_17210 [Novispirillum sp. DQ9]|uniref:hypothetical protein n=1 Tax=Novispirillum sp. DQ9 TaxID=3398612 RepID=UPI003C7D1A94
MRHRAPHLRTAGVVLASLFTLGALAACDEGGTPEQTGQVPPAEQQQAPAAEPAPPPPSQSQ